MAEKDNITAKNEKTFQNFKEKLSVVTSYIGTSKKFGRWLSIDKAYYLEARPRIVDILLTAESTLRAQGPETLGDQYPKMAQAFIDLVSAVAPFQSLFLEPELQASVGHLLETVAKLQAPLPASSEAPAPPLAVPKDPTSFPSTLIQPSQQMRPSSSSLANAITPTAPTYNTIPGPPANMKAHSGDVSTPLVSVTPGVPPSTSTKQDPANTTAPSSGPSSPLVFVAPGISPSTFTKQNPSKSISPSVLNTQSPVTANATPTPSAGPDSGSASAPPVAPTSKPKRKAKKKGKDMSDLLQADLQKYHEKKSMIQKPPEGKSVTSSSAPGVSSPVQVIQPISTPAVAGPPVSSLPKSRPSSRAQGTPMRDDLTSKDPAQATDGPSVSVSLPKSQPLSRPLTARNTPIRDESETKEPAPALKMLSSDAVIEVDEKQAEDVEITTATSVLGAASQALSPAMNDKVNRVLHTLTGLPSSEVGIAGAVDPGALTSDVPMPLVSHNVDHGSVSESEERPPRPTPIAEAVASVHGTPREESVDMDIDSSQETERHGLPATTSASLRTLIEEMVKKVNVEDVVNNVNRLIASYTEAPSSTSVSLESGEFSTAGLPIPNPQEVSFEDIAPSPKTGLEAATVIVHHRGLNSGSITIKFSIKQNQMDCITKWKNRWKHSDDLGDSLCLSLLCFDISDLKVRVESSQSNNLDTLLPEFECVWPTAGGLNMDALWNGQRTKLPLSPPFALPPNGLVDVNPFLVVGENTISLTQTRNMSEYWLLLCAHHPTPSQLNAVARRRHKERGWTGWLEKISQPLQLPFSMPITAQ
ncbi:hypothetical protein K438DRAFT_1937144 [Mycena galopus ATCC 62051]|nr:hypothetical protein K438DRAFT_1937144 [Mycena galopus ATCC 62051]